MLQVQTLRIHQFIPSSRANGPGRRAVVWVQGCSLGCPGCYNPETHDIQPDTAQPLVPLIDQVLELAAAGTIDGLTISGGEPFQQLEPVTALLQAVRLHTHLSTLVFSGYSMEELHAIPGTDVALAHIDVLIAGRYVIAERIASSLRGSANKQIHLLTSRHTRNEIDAVPSAEILIAPDGTVSFTGIEPLRARRRLNPGGLDER